jgi:hypothetical protein
VRNLDAQCATPGDEFQGRVYGCQTLGVVAAGGVEEEVLHVDYNQGGDGWGYGDEGLGWALGCA